MKVPPAQTSTDDLLTSVRLDLAAQFHALGDDLDHIQDLQALIGTGRRLHELVNTIIRTELAFQSGCHSDRPRNRHADHQDEPPFRPS